MRLGVTMFATDRSMPITDLARAAEERGLVSLWVPEHTHIPVSRRTPHPSGQPLPEVYKRTLDPLVALSYAAAVTERLTVGTGIMLLAQRDPIATAKAVATLDLLSGGRFALGAGFGWNAEEMESHHVPYDRRREVVREHVLAMKGLWTEEAAGFAGEHVAFEPSWSWPKPARVPPVYLGGGAGPKMFAHIAEYADGWLPLGGGGLRDAMPALREAAEKAGRDPATIEVIPFGVHPDQGKLEFLAGLGVGHVVCSVPSGPADAVLPVLDAYASLL
ncbi:LLM class F420-dependent oxidoreductase [Sphaerisporangium siamense]|uniref:Putative F420-dependent oxidoreductase n=1 Tax=Sphaerisporangium siamense TaxID=795645 RepID=A0A7W7DF34_9ACTN|nr:LLM class F420-dependent oxidoreductase [Sphaerisporangium siamense]MBB4705466.1 putative F420-dependent oxidoreductase [Sphaerisporangium siamense]GII86382.1 LLM class F420-dependent oxidoreductase [Sphaerisporangium siamense]